MRLTEIRKLRILQESLCSCDLEVHLATSGEVVGATLKPYMLEDRIGAVCKFRPTDVTFSKSACHHVIHGLSSFQGDCIGVLLCTALITGLLSST